MKKLHFRTEINAPAARVYKTMLGLEDIGTYQQWTAEFNPTSTYEGNWQKGSKMYFIGTDGQGRQGGMVSEIIENLPNEFVSMRHYAILEGKTEVAEGAEIEKWSGGMENYAFSEQDGVTTVTIETDAPADYVDYFNETWVRALAKLKAIAEK